MADAAAGGSIDPAAPGLGRSAGGGAVAVVRVPDAREAGRRVAAEIAELARARAAQGRACVLGLATGRSPVEVYRELARMVGEAALDLSGAVTFNLDEYLGLARDDPRSFRAWMEEQLFRPARIAGERAHVPRGDLPREAWDGHCAEIERSIRAAGGIDLQVLGLGRNGHVGFNEPGSPQDSRTRAVRLARETREDAAAAFGGIEGVPREAITLGIATILEARRLRILAFGAPKAEAVRGLLEGEIGPHCPASFLRGHSGLVLFADQSALSIS